MTCICSAADDTRFFNTRLRSVALAVCWTALLSGCSSQNASSRVSPRVLSMASVRDAHSARASSWDRTGGNKDCVVVPPGETRVLSDVAGPGNIQHVYIGTTTPSGATLRGVILRMYWDGRKEPCVETPLGDFFLTPYEPFAHPVRSALITINPGMTGLGSRGYHAYFPMPFAKGGRITIENQSSHPAGQLCYQIEYETYREPPPSDVGRFHAQWRKGKTSAAHVSEAERNKVQWSGTNLDGRGNYVILEAEGRGHLIGLVLSIDNEQSGWYGEGDDMIFIDGERWPPSLHGTGTEEISGSGATPNGEFASDFSGFLVSENRGGRYFAGKNALFRWYVPDPIRFAKSVRWTIEHGHANNFENEYSSVAYWYQLEPHKPFPALPGREERKILMPEVYEKARATVVAMTTPPPGLEKLASAARDRLRSLRREGHILFQRREWQQSINKFEEHARQLKRWTGDGK